ncbi:MAG: hypothetical protein ACYTFN_23385, partial [Planctomycetota bacterium]
MTHATRTLARALSLPLARILVLPLGVLASSAVLVAQSFAPGHVIGWAWNNGPLSVCSAVYTQDVDGGCPKAVMQGMSLCALKGKDGGGTAYDPRLRAVWVSNGTEIALHDIDTKRLLCRFNAAVGGSHHIVSGLALSNSRRELFQLETTPGGLMLSSYDVSKPCQPVHKKNWCMRKNTGVGATAMGLAYDEVRDFLYYTTSVSGFASWVNTLHVALRPLPCTDVQTFGINFCGSRPGGPVTGLGYDSGRQRLYATDGTGTRVLKLTNPAKGVFTDLTGTKPCCQFTGIGVWRGLAVVPNWQSTTVGKSCLDIPCGNCTSMKLGLVGGDAALGNRDFGFRLTGAPSGGGGFFYVSLGNCTKGILLPGLCGPIHLSLTAPWPVVLGGYPTPGKTPCTGQVTVITGVPVDPALC